MFAFGGFTDAVLGNVILFGCLGWALSKLLKNTDPEGKVKKAATDGIVRMLGRLFK